MARKIGSKAGGTGGGGKGRKTDASKRTPKASVSKDRTSSNKGGKTAGSKTGPKSTGGKAVRAKMTASRAGGGKRNGAAASGTVEQVQDYRHTGAKRKNIPPAKIAAEGVVPAVPKAQYQYNPHLPPVLRFDQEGLPDKALKLLEKAQHERLTAEEADRRNVRDRFLTACRVLGKERLKGLTVHHGRHSFISHALAGGRSLAEVRDAAGHRNIATTSIYTHVATDDSSVGDLFGFANGGPARMAIEKEDTA